MDGVFTRCAGGPLRTNVGFLRRVSEATMRGDWIYDWVRVEMEYRAGPRPEARRPPRHWTRLFARHTANDAESSANSNSSRDRRLATQARQTSFGARSSTGTCATSGRV